MDYIRWLSPLIFFIVIALAPPPPTVMHSFPVAVYHRGRKSICSHLHPTSSLLRAMVVVFVDFRNTRFFIRSVGSTIRIKRDSLAFDVFKSLGVIR